MKQYYEVLFLSYRPRTECSIQSTYFTILQYKLHSFNIQNDRSKRWLLAKPLKNCQLKSPILSAAVLTFAVRVLASIWTNMNRVKLQHNKELIMFIFYWKVLSMCNPQKHLIRAAFWVLLQAMFTERLKTNGTAIKITRETTNNQ